MNMSERDSMIVENLTIAEMCADKMAREFNLYAGNKYEREDLIQEALIAMLEATPKYDESRGVAYSTFVYAAMRRRLLEEIFRKKSNAKQVGAKEIHESEEMAQYDVFSFEDEDYIHSIAQYVKKSIDKYDGAIPTDVFIEKAAEGKSKPQIAKEMGIPIKSVYLKQMRIKAKAKEVKEDICNEMYK